jgi:hypothetical protein
MLGIIIVLFIMYIIGQILYNNLLGGFVINYRIKANDKYYEIKEVYNNRYKTNNNKDYDINSYYYEILNNDEDEMLFSFKLIGDYRGIQNFIKDIKIYNKKDLFCVYPIFKEHNNQLDLLCRVKDKQVNYANLRQTDNQLDEFIEDLKEEGYSHPAWQKINMETEKYEQLNIFEQHLLTNQNIIIWHYKGFYNISSKHKRKKDLIKKDVYNNSLAVLTDQYYVVPDYSGAGFFDTIIINNILTSSSIPIESNYQISTDAFLQGVVNNYIYIVDKRNHVQYEVDINQRKISIVGDKNIKGRYYYNGKWEERSIYEIVNEELVFGYEQSIPDKFKQYNAFQINEVLGDTDGYYYLYIKENNEIAVYRCDKQNINMLTLLFRAPNLNSVKYVNDSIYFLSDDTLYMYQDQTGLLPLVKYPEFHFNQNNIYDIYIENK